METPYHAINSTSFPTQNALQHSPIASGSRTTGEWQKSNTKLDGVLRRGYSDGETLRSSASVPGRTPTDTAIRETRLSLQRHYAQGEEGGQERVGAAAKGAAQVVQERPRNDFRHPDGLTRRRTLQSLSSGYSRTRAPSHSFTDSMSSHPSFRDPSGLDTSIVPTITGQSIPQRPAERRSQNRQTRETTLPQWQSDADVTSCPICSTLFSFWYRKHHCRKCGRVVCANCSPHRITIPRQFIVHPPEDATPSSSRSSSVGVEIIDLTSDDVDERTPSRLEQPQRPDRSIDIALGGGQEVRLCNPCVPDPNPLPHLPSISPGQYLRELSGPDQAPSSRQLRPSSGRLVSSGDQSFLPGHTVPVRQQCQIGNNVGLNAGLALPSSFAPSAASSSTNRRSSQFPPHVASPEAHLGLPPISGSAPDRIDHHRHLESLLQRHRSSSQQHRHHSSLGQIPNVSQHRARDIVPSASRPVTRPQLREEDECPVCHRALPPKGADGSEVDREEHVKACIGSHFSNSAPRTSHSRVSAITEAPLLGDPTATAHASNDITSIGRLVSGATDNSRSSAAQQRRRTGGMLEYFASEKDCRREDGNGEEECIICFEIFAIGDVLGRLECLCKFHKKCIRQWWDTKGYGSCPV